MFARMTHDFIVEPDTTVACSIKPTVKSDLCVIALHCTSTTMDQTRASDP